MRYLIAGANGMLGRDLQAVLADRDLTAVGHAEVDITDLDAVRAASVGHDVIINAAGYTNVDNAETHEDEAYAVNATGAANLAIAASENGARLVQLSTDYVFDGKATSPYAEDAPVNPLSAYGRTKAEGERLVQQLNPDRTLVVRTAWLYGRHGQNFATTMLRLASEREVVTVVTDQVGQPTWTLDLAHQLVALLDRDVCSGIFHGTNAGEATWYDFARAIFGTAGLDPDRVRPADSSQFVRPAPRPAYSVLGHGAWDGTGVAAMRDWKAALNAAAHQGVLEKQ